VLLLCLLAMFCLGTPVVGQTVTGTISGTVVAADAALLAIQPETSGPASVDGPVVVDLRITDETEYIDAAVLLTQINAQPYSKADWHWRINVAHRFGHAAAAESVKGTLALLDDAGIEGEMVVRDWHEGRAEVVQMWGRPESVRRDFRVRRSL